MLWDSGAHLSSVSQSLLRDSEMTWVGWSEVTADCSCVHIRVWVQLTVSFPFSAASLGQINLCARASSSLCKGFLICIMGTIIGPPHRLVERILCVKCSAQSLVLTRGTP